MSKKEFFYSETEKLAFYITGEDNSFNVVKIIDMLNAGADALVSAAPSIDRATVGTAFIRKSFRYQNRRYFYATAAEVPDTFFKLGEDWTMQKWIER